MPSKNDAPMFVMCAYASLPASRRSTNSTNSTCICISRQNEESIPMHELREAGMKDCRELREPKCCWCTTRKLPFTMFLVVDTPSLRKVILSQLLRSEGCPAQMG